MLNIAKIFSIFKYLIISSVLLYCQREPYLPSGLEPNSGCRWFL